MRVHKTAEVHDYPDRQLVFVMGPTCAGKSTLLNSVSCWRTDSVGLIEVGKILRAKYPPEHFNGMGAPKHTASEAWQIFLSELHRHLSNPFIKLVLVDGQPRDLEQALKLVGMNGPFKKRFVYIYVTPEEQKARIDRRHPEDGPAKELAMKRIHNDKAQYCDVLLGLIRNDIKVEIVEQGRVTSFDFFKSLYHGVDQPCHESSPSLSV